MGLIVIVFIKGVGHAILRFSEAGIVRGLEGIRINYEVYHFRDSFFEGRSNFETKTYIPGYKGPVLVPAIMIKHDEVISAQ